MMDPTTDATTLLCELVAIPSVNPAFLPDPDPRAGESAVAEFIAAISRRRGLGVKFQKAAPGRRNVLVRLDARQKSRFQIVLAPHMDTVGLPGDLGTLLTPVIRNGRLYGRGACDTKGSVAAMLWALFQLAESPARPKHTSILFAGLVDEENGQAGSRAFAETLRADLAIVGEPTLGKVVTAHKGDVWLELKTRGRAAHGARPELGDNAVHRMARVVDSLETEYAAELKNRRHPLLGTATVNVGTIRGGNQPNIVPDSCAIRIDRRTLPGETEASVQRELARHFKRRSMPVSIENAKANPCLPLDTDPRLPLVAQLLRTARQTQPAGVDFYCDASVLSRGGVPSVVLGPGDIAHAHRADEFISLKSLDQTARLLLRYFESLP